jgi:hypothetical protein
VRDDFELRRLLSEVTRTKAENRYERRSQVETAKVIATRHKVLSALEAFAAELARRRLPVPHAVNSDLRVLRALCGRGGFPT